MKSFVKSLFRRVEYRKGLYRCQASLFLALCCLPFTAPASHQAPLEDRMQVAVCVLMQGKRGLSADAGTAGLKLSKKDLPKSVRLYLKSSGMIDSGNAAVQKAARQVMKLAASKGSYKNPALLLEATQEWLAQHLQNVDSKQIMSGDISDYRKAWPKASSLIRLGKADAFGRCRVALAILRTLGVPARSCLVEGEPHVQAWMQFVRPRKTKEGKPAFGYWRLDSPALSKEPVEAWSLDSTELPLLRWYPTQELTVSAPSVERAYYYVSESLEAQEDFSYLSFHGDLPDRAGKRKQPPAVQEPDPQIPYLEIIKQAFVLQSDGPIETMDELQILAPYVPHLKSWGKEMAPPNGRFNTVQQALWTDRPGRLRHGDEGVHDEWQSPPPGLGVLHFLSAYFKRPTFVLAAELEGNTLEGKVLKSNSLAPAKGSVVQVEALDNSSLAKMEIEVDARGHFKKLLPEDYRQGGRLEIKAGSGREDNWDWIVLH